MDFVTIEYLRFGDAPGLLGATSYMRTIGVAGESQQADPPVGAAEFDQLMLRIRPRAEMAHPTVANDARTQLRTKMAAFLPLDDVLEELRPPGDERLLQIDVVTQAAELAQLPLEVLESDDHPIVITRRVRRRALWPPTVEARNGKPRVLFAWSNAHDDVPVESHRRELERLVDDYGGCIDEVPDATQARLANQLQQAGPAGYSHVHLLAHGIDREGSPDENFDPEVHLGPSHVLVLGTPGNRALCSPSQLASAFEVDWGRPSVVTLATCHGSEVAAKGGLDTFAHALHESGVPVVVASQFALTKTGSIELVTTFLAEVFRTGDPRTALRATRAALRGTRHQTYADDIAVVGYVHFATGAEILDTSRRMFAASLARLRVASKRLSEASRSSKPTTQVTNDLSESFQAIRDDLQQVLDDPAVRPKLLDKDFEEATGLIASSFKREAEAYWDLSAAAETDQRGDLQARSLAALQLARHAYASAKISADHHWVWTQWLSLEAILHQNDFRNRWFDWLIARRAAENDPNERHWVIGSLLEIWLLGAALPNVDVWTPEPGIESLVDELRDGCVATSNRFPLDSTLGQFRRYQTWWSLADGCELHPVSAERAHQVVGLLEQATDEYDREFPIDPDREPHRCA